MTLSEERLREMLAKMEDSRPHEHVATAAEAQSMARELLSIRSDAHTNGEVADADREAPEQRFKDLLGHYESVTDLASGMRMSARHWREQEPSNAVPQPRIMADFHDRVAVAIERLSLGQGEAEPVVWVLEERADNGQVLYSPPLWSAEEAELYRQANPGAIVTPLFASPQPPTPAGVREITDEMVEAALGAYWGEEYPFHEDMSPTGTGTVKASMRLAIEAAINGGAAS